MKRSAVVLGLVLVVAMACTREPAMVRQMHKTRLIEGIRQALLESVEAEKSAVLSTVDDESLALAHEARGHITEVNRLRGELRQLIVADGRQQEIEKLNAFDAAWAEVERVDQGLLTLAVANTNLKAARLSATEGAAHLDRFVDALTAAEGATTDIETTRALSAASIAALRIQPLLLVHIPSADDAEMTRLEERMRALTVEVDRNLASVRDGGKIPAEQLAPTTQPWVEYQRVVADVLRLSRENSNVISFDVSVHQKRHVMKECLAALEALQAATEVGPQGVR